MCKGCTSEGRRNLSEFAGRGTSAGASTAAIGSTGCTGQDADGERSSAGWTATPRRASGSTTTAADARLAVIVEPRRPPRPFRVINPTNLRRRSFASLLKRAGLPQIRFHDLRHTCATLLLSRNVHPKYVQELLGHANVTITLDTYSHVIPGMGDHVARAMEDALS